MKWTFSTSNCLGPSKDATTSLDIRETTRLIAASSMVTLHPWRLATRAVDSRTRAQEWSMEGQVRGSGGRSGAWREWSQFRAAVPPIPSPGELWTRELLGPTYK